MTQKNNPYTIQGTIINAANKEPLTGYYVRAFDADCVTEDDFLGKAQTDNNGAFTIQYRETDFVKNILESFLEGGPDLVLKIYDPERKLIRVTEPRRGAARFERYEIALGVRPPRLKVSIDEITKAAELPEQVAAILARQNVKSLGDLFSSEGIKALKQTDLNDQQRSKFLSAAKLAGASGSTSLSQKFLSTGITSLSQIAKRPATSLRKIVGLLDKDEEIAFLTLHQNAQIAQTMVSSVALDYNRNFSRDGAWLDDRQFGDTDSSTSKLADHIKDVLDDLGLDLEAVSLPDETCADCDTCEHAFSLFAYLFDLVDFINDNWQIGSDTLEKILFQEIDEMDCDAGNEAKLQIQFAIEVLEAYFREVNRPLPDWEDDYRKIAAKLLDLVGLSLDVPPSDSDHQALYGAAMSTSPRLRVLETLMQEVRQLRHQEIEDATEPEPLAEDADAEAIEQHERELKAAEDERATLKQEFEERLRTIVAPAFVDYRQLLITATGESEDDLESRLFIDLRSAPCHVVTRLGQLIQSLQSFVLAIRTGEIKNIQSGNRHPGQLIQDIDFEPFDEATWQWLRTYATWSAAMYVFVYPENLLMPPTLRGTVTPGFRKAIQRLRLGAAYQSTEQTLEDFDDHLLHIGSIDFELLSAHLDDRRVYVFASSGRDLWINTLQREAEQWSGWLEYQDWDSELRPQEVRFIDPSAHENTQFAAKFLVLTKDETYVVVTANGKVNETEKQEQEETSDGSVDQLADLFTNAEPHVVSRVSASEQSVEVLVTDFVRIETVIDFNPSAAANSAVARIPNPEHPLLLSAIAARRLEDETFDAVYLICQYGADIGIISARFRLVVNFAERVGALSREGDWSVVSGSLGVMQQWIQTRRPQHLPQILKQVYFEERFLHFPLLAAWTLNRSGDFAGAHRWFRRLYDPFARDRRQGFPFGRYFQGELARPEDWIGYSRDPHGIAATRTGAYLRHVILLMIKNLLDWADHEFSLATAESINRARELYLLAEQILKAPELENPCREGNRVLELAIAQKYGTCGQDILALVAAINRTEPHRKLVTDLRGQLDADKTCPEFREKARETVVRLIGQDSNGKQKPFRELRANHSRNGEVFETGVFAMGHGQSLLNGNYHPPYSGHTRGTDGRFARGSDPDDNLNPPSLMTRFFCIPANPLLGSFRSHISSNLDKIRSCRNIAGEPVPPQTLVQPTLGDSVITDINALTSPDSAVLTTPPRYRYGYLAEKARQQAALAQQLGSALLAAVEKRDRELYDQLVADHQEQLARAAVNLKQLAVQEAEHGEDVAIDQRRRAEVQRDFWEARLESDDPWINEPGFRYLSDLEVAALVATGTLGIIQNLEKGIVFGAAIGAAIGAPGGTGAAAAASIMSGGLGAVLSVPATLVGANIGAAGGVLAGIVLGGAAAVLPQLASFERREEEWRLQRELSQIDLDISEGQLTLAQDRVRIAEQDKAIADLQQTHAAAVVEFLRTKISNAELYEWMIEVLVENYRTVMQIAASTALMAQSALEFETQARTSIIQGDYWSVRHDLLSEQQQNLGLLGAERLLADLTRLDDHKLTTDKRRLQLSKTISLASYLTTEFVELKRTGHISFNTLMAWFDSDFPGHYMRLIKNVRVTVLALVPPNEGIHATLRNDGFSTVIVNENGTFVSKPALRSFGDSVALDAPFNDSGVFVLDYNDPMLLPFEGLGVETSWAFELPRASNRFNFDTIMDVLLTIEYTALHDDLYREQVMAQMGDVFNFDVVISLPFQYPDQWYHLNNPTDASQTQEVQLEVAENALPPNIIRRSESINGQTPPWLQHVTIAFTGKNGGLPTLPQPSDSEPLIALRKGDIQIDVLANQINENGFFSTRLSASSSPFDNETKPDGTWTVMLHKDFYIQESGQRTIDQINDLLIVLTVEGQVEW